ncbi:MAG: prenyltransferase/squalene oxidase repeat-containing protein [Verrucomicrobiota bacterium]
MSDPVTARIKAVAQRVQRQLMAEFRPEGCWEGWLSSSALSTAVAVLALARCGEPLDQPFLTRGLQWLVDHINADGGWGDTVDSPANLSTTLLCWCAFSVTGGENHRSTVALAEGWLSRKMGGLQADSIRDSVLGFYGNDRTFSTPILTVCALAGRLGENPWPRVPQLPFELAMFPHQLFRWLRLPVVSYAIPALIAIGLVRHQHAHSRWSLLFALRERIKVRVLDVLEKMQPESGGFLEATPLTGFVVLSLAAAGFPDHPVVQHGRKFLLASARPDGSWPIDTHLATWVTTLAVNHLLAGENPFTLAQRQSVHRWLLAQQHRREHPFTHAAPGGWAWTPLSGGVPDADDTAGALVALKGLGVADSQDWPAIRAGLSWLLDLQNSDGGLPTFCRGWGKLPFDRSCPDITAHALQAFAAWRATADPVMRQRLEAALRRGIEYLARAQAADGCWIPLWFGNQWSTDHANPTYGTAQVVVSLQRLASDGVADLQPMLDKGCQWLVLVQDAEGGWSGGRGGNVSIEETALAVCALAGAGGKYLESVHRGLEWLQAHTNEGTAFVPSPIGLYFASLWYYEKLYPLIFTVGALNRAAAARRINGGHPSSKKEVGGLGG